MGGEDTLLFIILLPSNTLLLNCGFLIFLHIHGHFSLVIYVKKYVTNISLVGSLAQLHDVIYYNYLGFLAVSIWFIRITVAVFEVAT